MITRSHRPCDGDYSREVEIARLLLLMRRVACLPCGYAPSTSHGKIAARLRIIPTLLSVFHCGKHGMPFYVLRLASSKGSEHVVDVRLVEVDSSKAVCVSQVGRKYQVSAGRGWEIAE